MVSRRTLRVVFALLLVASLVPVVTAALSSGVTDRYENAVGEQVTAPRTGTTVVVTSPRANTEAEIVAFAPNGSVLYYNDSLTKYFDVDPVEGTRATVEYIGKETRESCPPSAGTCASIQVERVNLTTGEVTVVDSIKAERRAGWHDVDRIDDHRLLYADINNRIFVKNTTTDLITWSYEFRSDYNRSAGGVFPQDWTHLNDVEYLGDGVVMASPRNMDQVVFIDMKHGLNASRTLGAKDDYDVLYEQHNPDFIPAERGGPAVVVADSENNRVIEYAREDGEWVQTWAWSDARLQWPRDADRLPNDHTLITDSNGNRVLEIDASGEVVWSVAVDTPYEAERLGTGSESTGGSAATSAGLQSAGDVGSTDASAGASHGGGGVRSLLYDGVGVVRTALPAPLVNGILFVLPAWFGAVQLAALLVFGAVAAAWAAVEFRWSAYELQSPIQR